MHTSSGAAPYNWTNWRTESSEKSKILMPKRKAWLNIVAKWSCCCKRKCLTWKSCDKYTLTLTRLVYFTYECEILSNFNPYTRSQMETVIKQAEENRARSLTVANKVHEEYLPLKNEIDHMRREYLGLSPIPDLHEEEGSIITAEYSSMLQKLHDLRLKQNNSIFSRFQNTYYPTNKVGGHSIGSVGFARPPLSTHHVMVQQQQQQQQQPEATVTSLPASAPPGFLPPPMGPMRLNKPPEMGPNRLQQSPSIGMAHPTFRSEFNVNLRYFMFIYYYFNIFVSCHFFMLYLKFFFCLFWIFISS